MEEALPVLDLDFLLLGLALPDFDLDLLLAPDFGLWDLDLGLCERDLGLCDLDFGDWDPDLGLCGPDLGLAERLLGVPERDLPLADPDRDLREPLRDLEALCFGLPEALDLDDPDLLLCADPERDLLERAGELDLLLDAFEDRLELAERLDLGDSLPDFAGLRETDLDWLPSLPGAGLGLLLRLALDPLSESEPESVSSNEFFTIGAILRAKCNTNTLYLKLKH